MGNVPTASRGAWSVPGQDGELPAIEAQIGRPFDIVKTYTDWQAGDTFPTSADTELAAAGRTLYFSWNALNLSTNKVASTATVCVSY